MEEDAAQAGWFWPSYETGFTRWIERLQGNAPEGADPIAPAETIGGHIWDGIIWVLANIIEAFYNILYALTHPSDWLAWIPHINTAMSDTEVKISLMRFIYFGGSVEFFFAMFTIFLVVSAFAFAYRPFMWGIVRTLEGLANGIGRPMAYAGLVMVLVADHYHLYAAGLCSVRDRPRLWDDPSPMTSAGGRKA